MAMSKAAKWISFAVPAPPTPVAPTLTTPKPLAPSVQSSDEKQFGLENFGNTCYANSVLQALYFCAPFRDLVLQSTDAYATLTTPAPPPPATLATNSQTLQRSKSERAKPPPSEPTPAPDPTISIPSSPPTLFSALRSLFFYISKNPQNKGVIPPRAFIEKLREVNELFRSSMHQDAHEFLNYLLNKIVEEIQGDKNHRDGPLEGSREDLSASIPTLSSGPPPTTSTASQNDPTLVQRLFEGTLTSETRCLTCETVSSRDESFLDLSIDIEQNSSVTACLRQFSASEMLCQKNKFFCDSCCGLQEAEKRMKIKKLPNVLALHLKRFKYQEDVQKYIKLAYRVAFPLELRLFNTVDDAPDPDRLYELFAIVVHIGTGPHHGHYITIIKGPRSWLVFDDDKIDTIKESEISKYFGDSSSGSAYVLYYQAVNLDPVSLGLRPTEPTPVPAAPSPLEGLPIVTETTTQSSGETEAVPAVPPGLGEDEEVVIGVAITSNDLSSDTSSSRPVTAPSTPATPATNGAPSSTPASASASPISSKKSLPVLRVTTAPTSPVVPPATPTSPTNGKGRSPRAASGTLRGSRKHGDLASPRRDEVSSRRPSTAPGGPSPSLQADIPPVPPLPSLKINGKDPGKEKEKEKAKEPDRKPSLWFKRRSLTKEKTKEKEREKEGTLEREREKEREKEKDASSSGSIAPSMSTVPSQSTATSEGGGAPVWRRRSFRLGHSKRPSASQSTFEGELDTAVPSSPALSPVPATPAPPVPSSPSAVPATGDRASPGLPHTPTRSRASSAASTSSAALVSTPRSSPPPLPNGTPTHTPPTPPPPPKPPSALRSPSPSSAISPTRRAGAGALAPRSSLRPSTAGASTSASVSTGKKRHSVQPAARASPVTDSEAQRHAIKEKRSAERLTRWRPRSAQGVRPAASTGAGAGGRTESPALEQYSESTHGEGEALGVEGSAQGHGRSGGNLGSGSGGGSGHGQKEGGAARLQRAARKLSLTAPLFGLGRHHHGDREQERERERERKEEKEREKEREKEERRERRRTAGRPPSAFLLSASAAAIAATSR
ncbi:hypothetical protein OF83DRAFT_1081920 [Amylostereum chailletii]|nr:hypothetical protein OF83DRAFT_1081920 [Amylostereum chailletii]